MSENKQRGKGSLDERAFRENEAEMVMFKAKERKTEHKGEEEALDDGELVELFRISDSLLRALRDFWRSYTGKDVDRFVSSALPPSLPPPPPPPTPIQPPDCSLNQAWGKTLQGGVVQDRTAGDWDAGHGSGDGEGRMN